MKPRSLALQVDSLPAEPQGKSIYNYFIESFVKHEKKATLSTFKFFLVVLSLLILGTRWYDYLLKKLFIYLYIYLSMLGLSCKHIGSLVVAWRISVPWPGIEPGPPALGARSLSHWTTREVP